MADDLVVTNAHVVAGEDDSDVVLPDGSRMDGTVVAFDPVRTSRSCAPQGRPTRTAAGRGRGRHVEECSVIPVAARSRSARSRWASRSLRSAPTSTTRAGAGGRSWCWRPTCCAGRLGGALVDPRGQVVGVAFAIAPDRPSVAYALVDEVTAVLSGDLTQERDTGNCLV